ncbi:MAG: ribonuclease Z [Thermodesulfobacteriota bacterium]
MRPTFQPLLVNDPFDDPCLYINCIFQNRAVIFDLGDIHALSPGEILKISHCFISHTHIDHFAGFDRLLRLLLGRDKTIHLFGPENFINNMEGKLAGYTWNLAANYAESLTLHITEIRTDGMRTRICRCRDRFQAVEEEDRQPFTGLLWTEPGFSVSAIILDHGIPCLGFRLNERFHINIKKTALAGLGLEPGPWLNVFKQLLFSGYTEETEITIPGEDGPRVFRVTELAGNIALITPGQTITYITDVVSSDENNRKIVEFASGSDHLFIESHFLDEDRETARAKFHLTAAQAGRIAALCGAKRLTTFHYSPRYIDRREEVEREAGRSFK